MSNYVVRLLDETRDEINRCDTKASVLIAGITAGGAILGTELLDPNSTLRTAGAPTTGLSIASVAGLGIAIVLLGVAVLPRVGQPTPGMARYFGEFAIFASPEQLRTAVQIADEEIDDRHSQQLLVLSRIVGRKYRLVQAAIGVAAIALVLLVAAILAT
jgi:hypothetical protein